jgi:chromosome segregation ATPase
MESVLEDMQQFLGDLHKLEDFGESEESIFQIVDEQIEDARQQQKDIYEDVMQLSEIVDDLKSKGRFADVLYKFSAEYYKESEPSEQSKRMLETEIREAKQKLIKTVELMQELEQYSDKELQIEEDEIKKIKKIIEELKTDGGAISSIESSLNPQGSKNVDVSLSGDTKQAMKGIKQTLKKVIETLNEHLEDEEEIDTEIEVIEEDLEEATEEAEKAGEATEHVEEEVDETTPDDTSFNNDPLGGKSTKDDPSSSSSSNRGGAKSSGFDDDINKILEGIDQLNEAFSRNQKSQEEVAIQIQRTVNKLTQGMWAMEYSDEEINAVDEALSELDKKTNFTQALLRTDQIDRYNDRQTPPEASVSSLSMT